MWPYIGFVLLVLLVYLVYHYALHRSVRNDLADVKNTLQNFESRWIGHHAATASAPAPAPHIIVVPPFTPPAPVAPVDPHPVVDQATGQTQAQMDWLKSHVVDNIIPADYANKTLEPDGTISGAPTESFAAQAVSAGIYLFVRQKERGTYVPLQTSLPLPPVAPTTT